MFCDIVQHKYVWHVLIITHNSSLAKLASCRLWGETLLFVLVLIASMFLSLAVLTVLYVNNTYKVKQLNEKVEIESRLRCELSTRYSLEQTVYGRIINQIEQDISWLSTYIVTPSVYSEDIHILLKRIGQLLENAKVCCEPSRVSSHTPILLQPWLKNKMFIERGKTKKSFSIHVSEIPNSIVHADIDLLEKAFDNFLSYIKLSGSDCSYSLRVECKQGLHFSLTCESASSLGGDECTETSYFLLKKQIEKNGGALCCQLSSKIITKFDLFLPAKFHEFPKFKPRHGNINIADETKARIIIVESDPEYMDWLYYQLSSDFRITLCQTCKGAQYDLDEQSVELILCNAQLSDDSPIKWLSRLRQQPEYATIPFVMLTTNNEPNEYLQAWQSYVDDCISKNTLPALLKMRLNALIENRRLVQKKMLSLSLVKNTLQLSSPTSSVIAHETPDEQFSKRLRLVIDNNITSQELTVDFVAKQLNTSSRSLQRRIQAMFGIPYTQYLKNTQLQIAKDALVSGHTIKQAAYYAGFSSQNYFGRVFRTEYGITPSQFKKDALTKPPYQT